MHHPKPTSGDTAWFVQDRFGMFIHWGIYALAARHEWVRNYEKITVEDYQKYFDHFDPDMFDPKAWAKAAREAGMKYFVITTKHHDGFCLFDSQYTDYKSTNTKLGKDIIKEVVEAFRAEGLKVGLYYSLIDWYHPEFPIDGMHPLRDHPDAHEMNKSRDMTKYTEYMHNQVREILTNYGKIDILWFDFSYPWKEYRGIKGKDRHDWRSEDLIKLVRELQPGVIVNNRLDLENPEDPQADVHTPEQFQPSEWVKVYGEHVVWETCQTLSGSWGYHRDETTWKSPEQLINMLVGSVALGGNLLMNIGPTGRGYIDDRAIAALNVYGEWLRLHARSIYGCTQSEYTAPADCRYTQKGNRLYVHILNWPFRTLTLPGLEGKVEYAQLLNDCSEIRFRTSDEPFEHEALLEPVAPGSLALQMPITKPNVIVPVIELFLKSQLNVY